ncbi:MAG: hypothetical protein AAFS04_13080 [Cyanobacteria bacterium J06631_9]
MNSIPYRLIWFQHFHKAAETSVTNLAVANNESFYTQHKNGIPVLPQGKKGTVGGFNPWDFSDAELTQFVDHCEDSGVTFVANEWGSVNFEVLAADPRVVLITCLRDPLKRFLSNFYFDYWHGYDNVSSPQAFMNVSKFSQSDFYCKFLSRTEQAYKEKIGEEAFHTAKTNLLLFDHVVILESTHALHGLCNSLGWTEGLELSQKNKTHRWDRSFVRSVLNGRFDLAFRRFSHPKRKPSDEFHAFFQQNNRFDIELYNFAKNNERVTTRARRREVPTTDITLDVY